MDNTVCVLKNIFINYAYLNYKFLTTITKSTYIICICYILYYESYKIINFSFQSSYIQFIYIYNYILNIIIIMHTFSSVKVDKMQVQIMYITIVLLQGWQNLMYGFFELTITKF